MVIVVGKLIYPTICDPQKIKPVPMVLYSEGILDVMSKPYPEIAAILKDDNYRRTMIEALCFQQCLAVFGGSPKLKAKKKGTNNLITWKEYRPQILKHLKSFQEEKKYLDRAREQLADTIYRKHYERYPKWPKIGESQVDRIWLEDSANYKVQFDDMNWHCVWTCAGWLDVKDTHPEANQYYTVFKGDPELRCVCLELVKLKQIDDAIKKEGVLAFKRKTLDRIKAQPE